MALFKNVAGQKLAIYAWDIANAEPKTGDAANITARISEDGGGAVQSIDVNPTEIDAANLKGIYVFDLDQGETNCDLFVLKAVSSTADIEISPIVVYTVVLADYMANVSTLALEATAQLIKTETDKIPTVLTDTNEIQGKLPTNNIMGSSVKTDKDDEIDDIKTETDKIQPDIIAVPGNYKADVTNLDVAVSSRSSHTAADVWTVAARTLTSFGTLVADIWAAGIRTLTSFGTLVADVWGAGVRTLTAGTKDVEIDAILTDTNEIQGKLPTNNIMGSSVKADMDDEIDAIKVETDKIQPDIIAVPNNYKADVTNLDVAVSTRSSHTAAAVWAVGARTLTSFGTLVADIWAHAARTLTSFGTLVADVWGAVARTLTAGTKDAEIDAIKTETDKIQPDIVAVPNNYKADVSNLDVAVSSRSSHTAAAVWAVGVRTLTSFGTLIADIWAAVTRTLTAGTRDTEIDAIKLETDKIQPDIIAVPNTYKADVSNLDATVSSRSSHTAADIWAVGARTLTSFGTLVADVWAHAARTLTSFGTLVADVWTNAIRTLTAGTKDAEIDAIKLETDKIVRVLGLVQENFRVKTQVYDVNGNLISATICIYGSAADCDADVNDIAEYSLVATYDVNGNCDSYKVTKV